MLVFCFLLIAYLNFKFKTNIFNKVNDNLFNLEENKFNNIPSTWKQVQYLSFIKKDSLGKNTMEALKDINYDYYFQAIENGLDLSNLSNDEFQNSTLLEELEKFLNLKDSMETLDRK